MSYSDRWPTDSYASYVISVTDIAVFPLRSYHKRYIVPGSLVNVKFTGSIKSLLKTRLSFAVECIQKERCTDCGVRGF
jgi:hypothetical protein